VLTAIRGFLLQGTAPSKTGGDNTFLGSGTNAPITDWCDSATSSNSSLTLRMTYADINDYLPIKVGEVMAINTKGITIPAGCTIDLGFKGGTTSAEVFTIKKVYKDARDNVKPYAPEDMLLYCIGDETECGSQVAPTASIELPLLSGSDNTININMKDPIGVYSLYEVRVLPLKGDIQVSVLPSGCDTYFYNYRLESEVKCKGESRAIAVIIPNIHNMGYLPLFDYTIYNGTGSLSPN